MIVITKLVDTPRWVIPGDVFQLTISDDMGCEVLIREKITVTKVLDFIASYRFALEDGTCPGFHLSGIFGCRAELPEEMRKAKLLCDLTPEQLANFIRTVGVEIK